MVGWPHLLVYNHICIFVGMHHIHTLVNDSFVCQHHRSLHTIGTMNHIHRHTHTHTQTHRRDSNNPIL